MPDFLTPVQGFLTSGIQSATSGAATALALGGPMFGVKQLANTRTVRYALVSIPYATAASPTSPAQKSGQKTPTPTTFTFPISPQALQVQRRSLSNWFETQAPANPSNSGTYNVQRIIDLYGLTPMIFSLRGTTGFNQYAADNYKQGGTDWMKTLQTFIENYFTSIQIGKPVTLQFFDFFYQEFWNVTPVGPVAIRHSAEKPLWMFYELTLAGTTRIQGGAKAAQATLTQSVSQSKNNVQGLLTVMRGVVTGAALVSPFI